jgi:hypothetical protein
MEDQTFYKTTESIPHTVFKIKSICVGIVTEWRTRRFTAP